MVSKIWLHIGAEKTGTTSIQAYFALNRAKLAELGCLYPASLSGPNSPGGGANHVALTAYALDDSKIHDQTRILTQFKKFPTAEAFRNRVRQGLVEELSARSFSTMILSNEHCSSRLQTDEEVRRLKRLCNEFSQNVTVVFYVRNQIDFLASHYSTTVTGGNTKPFPSPIPAAMLEKANYDAMLKPWESVFGRENVVVRLFESREFKDKDLLEDVSHVMGVSTAGLDRPERKNESLSPAALTFLREFNKHVPRILNGEINVLRGQIVEALRAVEPDARFAIPRSDAEEAKSFYVAGNQALKRRYFPDREAELFSAAKAVADEQSMQDVLPFETTVEIASTVWKFARRHNIKRIRS